MEVYHLEVPLSPSRPHQQIEIVTLLLGDASWVLHGLPQLRKIGSPPRRAANPYKTEIFASPLERLQALSENPKATRSHVTVNSVKLA